MTVTVVIQARASSTRLPGKVLMFAAGAPLLQRMSERVLAARTPTHVVIATTEAQADDAIVEVARRVDVPCVRGHATDCLDRHLLAARATGADVVVKIPSDCPLIDPATIDRVIGDYLRAPADYVSNLHPATWPDGFDVEVMSRDALETAGREAQRPHEREHTTPFLWDQPYRFAVRNVRWETGLDESTRYRLTLDYAADYAVIRGVYDELWRDHRHFTLAEIRALLAANPALASLNAAHVGASWMRNHTAELRTHAAGGTR